MAPVTTLSRTPREEPRPTTPVTSPRESKRFFGRELPTPPQNQAGPVASAPGPSSPAPDANDPWDTDEEIIANPFGFAQHHFSFMDPTTQNLELIYNALDARKVPVRWATNASGRSNDKFYIGDTMYDWLGDVGGPNAKWWGGAIEGPGISPSGSGGGAGGGVFTDPATADWEKLLRTVVERLNQPQPEYTPAQMEVLQTQALNPMTQQRDAARQQTMQRFAARGINPGSGILEQALQDVDRQFDQNVTNMRSAFTAQNIARGDQRFASDEARALQSVGLMGQIPQLADSRLRLAQGQLVPSNPAQYLSMIPGFQNVQMQNQAQAQQFWTSLAYILADSFL